MVFLNLAFPFPILLLLAVRKEIELGEVNAGSVPSFQRCPEGIGLNVKSGIGGKGDRPGIVEGGGCVGADHCIPGAADQAGTMGCVSADDRVQREGTQHRKEKANLKLRSLAKPETVVEDRTGGKDRKRVVEGKRGAGRLDIGGGRTINKKKEKDKTHNN